jgi:peptide/nickel transport system permease protein
MRFLSPTLNVRFIKDALEHAILPALSIMLSAFGNWLLQMRSLIVSLLDSDYIQFADVRGIKKNVILMKYAFRNALLPQITGLAMSLGQIMSGSLLCEIIFNYPGIGQVFYQAIQNRDYNLIQGVLLFTILAVLTANLVLELFYPLIDPRIRQEGN